MSDEPIPNALDDGPAAGDADAGRSALSRTRDVLLKLAREDAGSAHSAAGHDLRAFSALFPDLADDIVMSAAWR